MYTCRLKRLPARIGNLTELKELHLRTNQLRYYPISITELDIYTINGKLYTVNRERFAGLNFRGFQDRVLQKYFHEYVFIYRNFV